MISARFIVLLGISACVFTGCSKSEPDRYAAGHNDFEVGFKWLQQKDYAHAKEAFKNAAEKGHPAAQSFLGGMYLEGQGGLRDLVQAVHWFEKAAEGGDVTANFDLAVMYENGRGVSRDPSKAETLYRRAAEKGLVRAQFNLAGLYASGEGVAKSPSEAYRWYCTAAKAPPRRTLGADETAGLTTAQALDLALLWKASSDERQAAMNNCGVLHGALPEKKITELDNEIQAFWAKKSDRVSNMKSDAPSPQPHTALKPPNVDALTKQSETGDSNSQLELAVYYEGQLYQNTPNLELAHKWFFEAAKRDNYLAQLALASLTLKTHRFIVRNDFDRPSSGLSRGELDESVIDAIAWYEIAKLGAKKNGSQVPPPAAEAAFLEKYKPIPILLEEGKRQAIEWRNKYLNGGIANPSSEPKSASTELPVASIPLASAPATTVRPSDLVAAMTKAAATDRFADLNSPKSSLDSLPKPERGDRRAAREKNAAGLDALKKEDYTSAIARFNEGTKADPSDIELINNLGFALMMAGKLNEAKSALIETLAIDSSRGAAWSNLGQLLAKSDDESSAVACFKLTYYFSKAPEKTIEFYRKLAETDSDERVRTAAAKAAPLFSRIQPTITTVRYQYQKLLDALPPGPAGIGSPSQKVVEVLASPTSADDWAFIKELEADLGQCSTGSACARETEITQAKDKRKVKGIRSPV